MASGKRIGLFIGLGLLGVLAWAIGFLVFHLPSGYPLIDESEVRIDELRILTEQQNAFYAKHQRFAASHELCEFGNGEMRAGGYVYVVLVPEGWIGACEAPHPLTGRSFYCTHKGEIFVHCAVVGSANLTSYDKLNELAARSDKKVVPAHSADR